jgi:hypothetical protein
MPHLGKLLMEKASAANSFGSTKARLAATTLPPSGAADMVRNKTVGQLSRNEREFA